MAQSKQVSLEGPVNVVSKALTATSCTGATTAAIDIPASSFVPPYGVQLYVVATNQGGSSSITVGDGTTADGWIDATACDEGTVAGVYSGTDSYTITGRYYSSADTIDITWNASATAGVVYISCLYYDWSDLDLASS